MGLPIANLTESVRYKVELEEQGLTVDNLKQFLHVARKFGSVSKVIEAIDALASVLSNKRARNKDQSQYL